MSAVLKQAELQPVEVCELDHILPFGGVCAMVAGEQVAIFRVGEAVYAVSNFDPFSQANVISRGIVGSSKGQPVIISPIYKQRFDLETGVCIEDPHVALTSFPATVVAGKVVVYIADPN